MPLPSRLTSIGDHIQHSTQKDKPVRRPFFSFFLLAMLSLVSSQTLQADNRAFVWTYQYQTMEAGEAEFEAYTTFKSLLNPTMKGTTTAQHHFELEIGMNNRFDVGIYQVFEQAPEAALTYKGYQLRARYRLGKKDQYPMDPLLYFEYKGKPDFSAHTLEGKLILAKDIGKLHVALNPVIEIESEDGAWERKLEYKAGVSYRLRPLADLGLELQGGASGHYLGPVISHGRDKLYVALGSAFALGSVTEGKPRFMLRMIIGVGL